MNSNIFTDEDNEKIKKILMQIIADDEFGLLDIDLSEVETDFTGYEDKR